MTRLPHATMDSGWYFGKEIGFRPSRPRVTLLPGDGGGAILFQDVRVDLLKQHVVYDSRGGGPRQAILAFSDGQGQGEKDDRKGSGYLLDGADLCVPPMDGIAR